MNTKPPPHSIRFRHQIPTLILVALAASGCGPSYDCVAACEPHAEAFAEFGQFASTTTPETVCLQPAIQSASNCGECYEAILDTQRLGIPADLACSCPAEEMNSDIEIFVPDDSCLLVGTPWTEDACFEHHVELLFGGCSAP